MSIAATKTVRATKPGTAKKTARPKTDGPAAAGPLDDLKNAKERYSECFKDTELTERVFLAHGDPRCLTKEGVRLDSENYDACQRFDVARAQLITAIEKLIGDREHDCVFRFLDGTILGLSHSACEGASGSPVFMFSSENIVGLPV
jgi:hypothetical protein